MRMNRSYFQSGIVLLAIALFGCQSNKRDGMVGQADIPDVVPPEVLEASDLIPTNPRKAQKRLSKWIKANQNHPAMDDALFYKAQAQEARGKVYPALQTYEELAKNYGGSSHFYDTLHREVALAEEFLGGRRRPVLGGLLRFTAYDDALEVMENVALRWPGSELAGQALMKRANFYYERKAYEEAQQAYQLLIDNYQATEHYQTALRNSAEATLLQYLGPRYDPTPLIEAHTRYKQYLAQFPVAAAQEGAPAVLAGVEEMLAEKDFETADFYRRTHKIDQAQIYWQSIIANYPHTEWAQLSATLLLRHAQGSN